MKEKSCVTGQVLTKKVYWNIQNACTSTWLNGNFCNTTPFQVNYFKIPMDSHYWCYFVPAEYFKTSFLYLSYVANKCATSLSILLSNPDNFFSASVSWISILFPISPSTLLLSACWKKLRQDYLNLQNMILLLYCINNIQGLVWAWQIAVELPYHSLPRMKYSPFYTLNHETKKHTYMCRWSQIWNRKWY